MKKVYFALALCCVVSMVFVVSCKKEEQQANTGNVTGSPKKQPSKITTFANLKADVTVKDEILNFKSLEDFNNVINFLSGANEAEIDKWEKTLSGFTSVFKYFDSANDEFMIDTLNQNKFQELKVKYAGKADFEDKNELIKPVIDNGNVFGRVIGLKGQYRVGKSIIQYHKNKVISIPDGDEDKLNKTMLSLKSNIKEDIFVHNLFVKDDLAEQKSLNQRAEVLFNWTCPNNCPLEQERESIGDVGEERYKLREKFTVINNSGWVFGYNDNGRYGKTIEMNIGVKIEIEHKRKRWWGGYSATYGGFNWGFGWGVTMALNINGVIFPAPFTDVFNTPTQQGGGWTWFHNNANLYTTIPLWQRTPTDPVIIYRGIFDEISFTGCVNRTGLVSQSGWDPTNIRCSQYCQDGNTTE